VIVTAEQVQAEGVKTLTHHRCTYDALRKLDMPLVLLCIMRKEGIAAFSISLLVCAILLGSEMTLYDHGMLLDNAYDILCQYILQNLHSAVTLFTAAVTICRCAIVSFAVLFIEKTRRRPCFDMLDEIYVSNKIYDAKAITCCPSGIGNQVDQRDQPQSAARKDADAISMSIITSVKGAQIATCEQCVKHALDEPDMLSTVRCIIRQRRILFLLLVCVIVVGSRTILNDCGTELYAAYENAYQYGAEKRNSTAVPFIVAAETAKLILIGKKLRRFPLGQPMLSIKPDGCVILVHRAVAATVPSGAYHDAYSCDMDTYSEVLRPAVLKDKYKSCDFGKDTEFYACNVGPQAYPQATTIIGEDAQGCILACEKDVHTSFICVLGEERRREKRKTRKTLSRKSETLPQTGLRFKRKIKGGISNKSHGLDDVTLDLPKQPKVPPFDLVIKYANFESKAA